MNNNKQKKNIVFFILAIIGVSLFVLTMRIGAQGAQQLITVFGIEMQKSNLQGVMLAFFSLFCVFMVCIDNRKGAIFANVLLLLNLFFVLRSIVIFKTIYALPGLCNCLIYIFIVNLTNITLRNLRKTYVIDKATGFYNAYGFRAEVERAIRLRTPFDILYIRINGTSGIIDSSGYEFGNQMLREISRRIRSIVGEKSIIGKFDGREFAVIVKGEANSMVLAQKLVRSFSSIVNVEVNDYNVDCYLPAYVGITNYPKDAMNAEELIGFGGTAAHYAILEHNDSISYYDNSMQERIKKSARLEHIISEALDKQYFYQVFQPQFYTDEKKLRGFEALLRLKLPDGTVISPAEFIPVAENSKLIFAIDEYVMRHAIETMKKVILQVGREFTVSVNVSARNISSVSFVPMVANILKDTEFPPHCLEIEITEYSFGESEIRTTENIKALRNLGVKIALDDFGTGYTSIAKVVNLPINAVKIDKTLIDDIVSSKVNRDFVDAIIYMGHLMGCEVVAEGVEQTEQLAVLTMRGCDFIQGFIWGKPMEYEEVKQLCNREVMKY